MRKPGNTNETKPLKRAELPPDFRQMKYSQEECKNEGIEIDRSDKEK
jgi:hypothetical protein